MLRFGLALGLAALVFATPARAQNVTPQVTCADQHADHVLVGYFGWTNPGPATTLPIGADNLFFPGAQNRGQPTTFAGLSEDPFAFRVAFPRSASMPSVTWFLDNTSVTLDASSAPSCGPQMFWAGAWQPGRLYVVNDVVAHGDSTWVAEASPGTTEPGAGAAWQVLASTTPGPQGPAGPAGARGPAGPAGAPGPPGPQLTFLSPHTLRFSARGRRHVRDPHVSATSVIVVQYMGRGGRATAVARLRTGSFVATGSPGHRFRYVVYNQP